MNEKEAVRQEPSDKTMSEQEFSVKKLSEQEQLRVDKIKVLENLGVDPFGGRFDVTAHSEGLKLKYADTPKEELDENPVEVAVAGRIMTRRSKGKAGFMHIQDNDGQIQIYLRQDVLSELDYQLFDMCDIGDIIGIRGTVFRTNTGEISVKAKEYIHLTKALKPDRKSVV